MTGLTPEIYFIYLDDIIVFSFTIDEQIKRLEIIFDRMREANFKFKPSKCKLLQSEVKYLGHITDEKGIRADPDKITVFQDYPRPKTVKDIRALIGLAGFYRRFMPNFSSLSKTSDAINKEKCPVRLERRSGKSILRFEEPAVREPRTRSPQFFGALFINPRC